MNANAKKWVAALRSGEYEQATGQLRRGGRFCCLGVACEVFILEGGDLERIGNCYGNVSTILPLVVQQWLGIHEANGQWNLGTPDLRETRALSAANDNGATFDEIATLIESEPPGLFVEDAP